MYSMSKNKCGNLRKPRLYYTMYLQKNTISIKRKVTSDFHIHFCNVIVHAKTTICTPNDREALRWILPKWRPGYYFVEYKAISKIFAVINHQYIYIYSQHEETGLNVLISRSFFLKALFQFISQYISVP